METVAPVPTMASRKAIEEFAEDLRRNLNLPIGDTLFMALHNLGGRDGLPREGDPPALVRIDGDRDFTFSRSWFATRQRETYDRAYILAHLFLHWPMTKAAHPGAAMLALVYPPEGDDAQKRACWEANWFATVFLMPEVEFAKTWQKGVRETCEHFGLLERHVRMRAKTLGLPAWGLEAAEEMPV